MPQHVNNSTNGRLLASPNAEPDSRVQSFEQDDQVRVHKPRRCCTKLVKTLVVIIVVLLLLCAALLTSTILLGKQKPSEVCMTSDCIKTAAILLDAMDQNVNPCDDFYQFACGNWIRTHPIPDDRATVSNFEEPTHKLQYLLKKLFDDKAISPHGSAEKVKGLYKACQNDTAVLQTWRKVFDEALDTMGGWPVLNKQWAGTGGGVGRLFGVLNLKFYQPDFIFKFTIGADDKNSTNNVFQVDQATLALHAREIYLLGEGQEERDAYLELMTETVRLLGGDSLLGRKDMAEVMFFETQLANITTEESRHDAEITYMKLTLDALMKRFNHFDWIEFLDAIYPGRKWSKQTEVVIYCEEFLDDLNRLLHRYDKRVITNYLIWRWFYAEILPQLPDPYYMVLFKFNRALGVMKVPELRWKGCVRETNKHMFHATGAMYVQKHFNPSIKEKTLKMIEQLKEAFHALLDENDWLSPQTRAVASEKVEAMTLKIGYPDFITNFTEVDVYYNDYSITDGDYYKSKFNVEYNNNKAQFSRIDQPVEKALWVTGSAVVNAFYSPNTNEIMFPVGILTPVFYSEKYPWAMNFGGIGVVIGHEITHGFDDKGRKYDKDGNIREWWDNDTIQKFEDKARCMEDQYSSYTINISGSEYRINGKLTKGENIADNGGLKQAFRAYTKWSQKQPTEPKLPGLNYTLDQLFFINYAQIWCGSSNDKEAFRKLKTSVHSPGKIRVRGPLSNSYDFAQAFNCPSGSYMNPEPKKKCKVW